MNPVVKDLLGRLVARGETLATAESLTGGLLAATIVDVPGASNAYRGGLVVYATDLKATLAGVPPQLLEARGAVDPDVAAALAGGVRQRCRADWGLSTYGRYARDLIRDPFYKAFERPRVRRRAQAAQWLLFLAAGLVVGGLTTRQWPAALQLGLSWLVWGVIVRTVLTWHISWSVNSVTHRWGYRNFPTPDNSRNNWLVALLTLGEGWHNNHHAQPRSAALCVRWWEVDVMYLIIRGLEAVGLAWDVVRPGQRRSLEPPEGARAA